MTGTADVKNRPAGGYDEELIDVLTAISVVARMLARRFRRANERLEEKEDEQ